MSTRWNSSRGLVDLNIRIIPSSDVAFRRHVDTLTARHAFASASELAARLRTLFPRVVVRSSEVSGQHNVWYVYRDGVWANSDESWWAEDHTPRVIVTTDGWIEEANAPARAILGLTAADEMPQFFTDFAAPGTLRDATDLFAVVADGHELVVTTLVRPTSGEVIACDLRAWTEGERIVGAFRLADDTPAPPPVDPIIAATLVCHPEADVLFARYAEEALARMPEPTLDGLTLRLRRLYPTLTSRWAKAPGVFIEIRLVQQSRPITGGVQPVFRRSGTTARAGSSRPTTRRWACSARSSSGDIGRSW